MDRGFSTGMVMIDLQKAFDTVDHDILLQKLKALGFDPLAIKWFESYLKGRNQKTENNVILLTPEWFLAEYRRDPFWGHCYFYYILMTWRLLSHVNLFFMLTTQPF